MIRIIIAGSRNFNDYDRLEYECSRMISSIRYKYLIDKNSIEIISGTANGADKLGEKFANSNNISVKKFPANWSKYGKRAGYIRNCEMADYATQDGCEGFLFAFWDGKSKGTKMMIDIANKKGINILVVFY